MKAAMPISWKAVATLAATQAANAISLDLSSPGKPEHLHVKHAVDEDSRFNQKRSEHARTRHDAILQRQPNRR